MTYPELIVPNPMSKPFGTTQDGRQSPRCTGNAVSPSERTYWVVEFDKNPDGSSGVPLDSQARRLLWLAGKMRLVMVVHSGSKSLHGWFSPVDDVARQTIPAWCALAVEIGADPATFRPEQLVRFPWGVRRNRDKDTGDLLKENPYSLQRVLYLDHPTHRIAADVIKEGGAE